MKNSLLCFFFLLFLSCNSYASADGIELRISRNDILNPGSKKDLWLHIISHAKENIRTLTFRNGCATLICMVDSSGLLASYPRFSSPKRGQVNSNQKPFTISPGDTSGTIVDIKNFKLSENGLYYMIYAIPNPEKNSIIVSSPCRLFIKNNEFETVDSISFDDLPGVVKNTFRGEFEKFMSEERISLESCKLPF